MTKKEIYELNLREIAEAQTYEPTPLEVLERELMQVKSDLDIAVKSFVASIPESEVATYPYQAFEAIMYTMDNTFVTTMIDSIVAKRSVHNPTITKESLISKILEKSTIFRQVAGELVGEKQGLEDSILYQMSLLNNV
ncbi:MAG: hypothetical protein ACWGHH_06400 [Sulfurovaceae bacterium]